MINPVDITTTDILLNATSLETKAYFEFKML